MDVSVGSAANEACQAELQALGIDATLDLADVGRNLQDHPLLTSYWSVASNNTYDDMLRDSTILNTDLTQWKNNRTGRLVDSPVVSLAFMRIPDNSSVLENVADPAAGKRS